MGTELEIKGVYLTPLRKIEDERGAILHMMKVESPLFDKFGEVYFSITNPGFVKAWKKHKLMTQNLAVPHGEFEFVIYDCREDSPSFGKVLELKIGLNNYQLLTIPPMVIYGFKNVTENVALIANCADISHQPDESLLYSLDDESIPYKWKI